MNAIKRLIDRLLFPRQSQFIDNFRDAFLESVKEISQFDESVRDISQNWLAVCPHTYFSELFLETVNWNVPFVHAFKRSDMADAQGCYELTQAFYLQLLFRIIDQDEKYRKYSRDAITQNIRSNLSRGTKILTLASAFKKSIENMTSIDVFIMSYVRSILQTQYHNRNVLDSILTSISMESDSQFGLTVFTTESIKRAKYIDRQSSFDS